MPWKETSVMENVYVKRIDPAAYLAEKAARGEY